MRYILLKRIFSLKSKFFTLNIQIERRGKNENGSMAISSLDSVPVKKVEINFMYEKECICMFCNFCLVV